MSASSVLAPILSHLKTEPSRTWSVIITIYGDAVVPRGGALWLGSLLEICAALEIGGNVVRTAASRLAADGWLERRRVGRNSYYRLAEKGRATFAAATAHIYGPHPSEWDGRFHIALASEAQDRAALEAAGYAPLAPGVLIAVAPAPEQASSDVINLQASTDAESAHRLAARVWAELRIAAGYRRFIAAFEEMRTALDEGAALSDLEALVARVLLIHEYRRIVLHDPMLPNALLPPDWPGHAARSLCAALYRDLLPGSERWLDRNALNENGPLPPPEPRFWERFRG